MGIEHDGRGQDAVEDALPDVAQHDAADQVGHEKHAAVDIGPWNFAREGVGHGEGQHVNQDQ